MRMVRGTESTSDPALIDAAREGDRKAFAKLYSRYAPVIHGLLLSKVPRGEVDDLLQDVFLQALRRLPSLRDTTAFASWLATIARNRATDFHRQKRIEEPFDEETTAARGDERKAFEVLNLIRTLPEAYHETLVLRFVEGLTGPEIAARTGLTPGSVRVNLHRGVKMLREKMGLEQ